MRIKYVFFCHQDTPASAPTENQSAPAVDADKVLAAQASAAAEDAATLEGTEQAAASAAGAHDGYDQSVLFGGAFVVVAAAVVFVALGGPRALRKLVAQRTGSRGHYHKVDATEV
jgi:hypothetical protein